MQTMPYGVGHRVSKTHIREFCHSGVSAEATGSTAGRKGKHFICSVSHLLSPMRHS